MEINDANYKKLMKKINLYYHTGSANHGCEAIVRGTCNILSGNRITLFSASAEEEIKYEVNQVVEVMNDREVYFGGTKLAQFLAKIQLKMLKKTTQTTKNRHHGFFSSVKKGDFCLSIGGDNYTYDGVWKLADYNKILRDKGAKTILWGCSIDEELIPKLKEDLDLYSMIVARETMTFNALRKNNIKTKIRLCPDPAFQLEAAEIILPEVLLKNQTIGINLSPLILKYGNSELILKNFRKLFEHLIENTALTIMLIPHVVSQNNDDREILRIFYDEFKHTGRFYFIEDQDCRKLKSYIARCRFFIGARTHATIAAYSSQVPTVVAGYSMKAKGIAADIFGTHENYVCPVQDFQTETEMVESFLWLQNNEEMIKQHYQTMMPEYKQRAKQGAEYLKELY